MELSSEVKEAPLAVKAALREGVKGVEHALIESGGLQGEESYTLPGAGLFHSFGDGIYVRECHFAKGTLLSTKIHRFAHPFFLMKGKLQILSEDGPIELEAPHYGITPAGTKRAVYALEDLVWITVHPTKSKDLADIESEIIAEDFSEFPLNERIG